MNNINRSVFAIIAVALVLGLSACSTVKHEAAPMAPTPAASAPVGLEPKADRG